MSDFDIHAPMTPAQRQWIDDYHARTGGRRAPANTTNQGAPPIMVRSTLTTADQRAEMEHFSELVSEFMARNPGATRATAIARVAKRHPAAHQRYLKASNPRAAWGS